MKSVKGIVAASVALFVPGALGADTWQINMTVDNQFDAYVGTASTTVGSAVGTGSNWAVAFPITVNNMQPSDYFYVATSSDHAGAQGFLGDFTNTTQNLTFNTGSTAWDVFPVGAYLQQIDSSWPSSWPSMVMPTQTQVNQALAYGSANPSVWINPAKFANWDNRVSGNITTWGHNSGIDPKAEWIWNNVHSGNPFSPGWNHDEFLIFRVKGVPAPGACATLGLAGLAALRRRR